jgi:hypothetical protein
MAEYIDREALRKVLENWRDAHADVDDEQGCGLLEDVIWEVDAQPAADVAPVVHGRCGMKIYKNPWVSRESYFVKTGAAKSAKMEAAKSTGYSVDFWDGKWKVRKATYYNKSLAEMPVVCENKVSIQAVIGKAVLDAVHGFAGGGKSDGEETQQAGWLPVYESEITGWDPALAGRDPIGGYACSKCGYEAVYSCNDEYVLSDYCPGCGARMAGGAE